MGHVQIQFARRGANILLRVSLFKGTEPSSAVRVTEVNEACSLGDPGITRAINQSRRRAPHFPDGRNHRNNNIQEHVIVAKALLLL